MQIKNQIHKLGSRILPHKFKTILKRLLGQDTSMSKSTYKTEFLENPAIKQGLEEVDPKLIVTSDRLDVIVRYLFFRDIAYGNENTANKGLYCRTILARTGGVENKSFYSVDAKIGMEEHIHAAKELCSSIRDKGFQQENYIPVAKDYSLYNGAHRLAAAMALNQNVWIRWSGNHGFSDFGFDWFKAKGFSNDDKIRILRGYADIHSNCGIFMLYAPCMDLWSYIEKKIEEKVKIVGSVDLDFSNDYIAFENLICDVYVDYNSTGNIQEKIDLLKYSDLKIRVILVSDEFNPELDLFELIRNIKSEVRDLLNSDYNENAFVTIHSSDNKIEFDHLKNVVLSVNNIRCLSMRTIRGGYYRKQFLQWIEDFKRFASDNGFDTNDTCIVGSSPLEVMGIRNSTDIDIMIAPELRLKYGDGITHLTKTLDIGTRNYVRNDNGVIITDEQLIYDDNQHFIFNGCKFANIEHVYLRKQSGQREKDKKDVRLMQLYFDCYKYFDDKKALQRRIQEEVKRRGK